MSNWRPSSYTAKSLRRRALERFTHRSREMRIGTDKRGAENRSEWGRRFTKMHDWAGKRFGSRYTVATRPAIDDALIEILWFCFETPEDAAAFDAFLDSPEADEWVPRW